MSNLSPVIKSIQDIMRQDSGVDGDAQRISQLTWLLFLKVFDALEEELETTRDHYQSPIPEHLRWRAWAANPEGATGEALLDFVDKQLFPALRGLSADPVRNPRGYVVRGVFEDAYNYMKSGHLLRQVVNKLNAIDFNRQAERHQFNDLYEKILRDLQSAGNAGEFYTPRAVTQFMVDMTNPRLGESVMDPATGTGGFLVCAIEHLRKQVNNADQEVVLQNSIRGVEKKQMPHMLCVTNLLLHGIEVPSNIRHDNTLARPLREYTQADRVDVVLTNPPFGGVEEPGIEQGYPADVRTKETADLFLVLIKHILKVNGRAALVLPDGTLFGEGVKSRIKEQLLAECNLHTIVRLPNGVFAPYTGIKTNLLFFIKGQPTQHVWYYEHPYPPGVKNYNKTKPIRIEEFDAEKAWWGTEVDGFATRVENERAWKVSIDTIRAANWNLDQKNPHVGEQTSHDPEVLLADYARLQAEAQALRDELKHFTASTTPEELADNWQRVAQHFDLLLDRPEAIDALEQTLLQLAVRGMLVPQDPTDEPASELLTHIRTEKDRLVSEGKIKRDKPLSLIPVEEKPFELPESWEWARFGDVVSVSSGVTLGRKTPITKPISLPYLRVANVQRWHLNLTSIKEVVIDQSELARFQLQNGDLLITEGGDWDKVGRTTIWRDEIATCLHQNHVFKARGIVSDWNAVWAELFLNSAVARSYFASSAKQTTNLASINMTQLKACAFPMPPLAEQSRIVTRVTALRRLCADLRQRLAERESVHARLTDALVGAASFSQEP